MMPFLIAGALISALGIWFGWTLRGFTESDRRERAIHSQPTQAPHVAWWTVGAEAWGRKSILGGGFARWD